MRVSLLRNNGHHTAAGVLSRAIVSALRLLWSFIGIFILHGVKAAACCLVSVILTGSVVISAFSSLEDALFIIAEVILALLLTLLFIKRLLFAEISCFAGLSCRSFLCFFSFGSRLCMRFCTAFFDALLLFFVEDLCLFHFFCSFSFLFGFLCSFCGFCSCDLCIFDRLLFGSFCFFCLFCLQFVTGLDALQKDALQRLGIGDLFSRGFLCIADFLIDISQISHEIFIDI